MLKKIGLILFALLLVAGIGAVRTNAALTLADLTITSSGALTLESAAASIITIGALNTGGINIGTSDVFLPADINMGTDTDTLKIDAMLVNNSRGYGLTFDGETVGDNNYISFEFADPTSSDMSIYFPDASGTVSLINATETLTNKRLTSPILTNPTLGAATASSLTIGSGTINNLSIGNLADGTSGWVPDGAATSFTITASPSDIGAETLISVSLGANANLTTCSVSTRTGGISFVVNCSAAPANGATLQYMMVNLTAN